jgi:hypothetical protein
MTTRAKALTSATAGDYIPGSAHTGRIMVRALIAAARYLRAGLRARHGDQLTVIRPGPHSCPFVHASG